MRNCGTAAVVATHVSGIPGSPRGGVMSVATLGVRCELEDRLGDGCRSFLRHVMT